MHEDWPCGHDYLQDQIDALMLEVQRLKFEKEKATKAVAFISTFVNHCIAQITEVNADLHHGEDSVERLVNVQTDLVTLEELIEVLFKS